MQTSELILEILKIVVSWPVAIVAMFFLLRRDITRILDNLTQRVKSAKIAGNEIEFFDLEEQSKVTQLVEEMQKENPELVNKSLASVGINQNDYNEYRSRVRGTVMRVQRYLIELGYDLGTSGADGIPGADTRQAVKKFQIEYGLDPDGVIGPDTIGKLNQIMTHKKV